LQSNITIEVGFYLFLSNGWKSEHEVYIRSSEHMQLQALQPKSLRICAMWNKYRMVRNKRTDIVLYIRSRWNTRMTRHAHNNNKILCEYIIVLYLGLRFFSPYRRIRQIRKTHLPLQKKNIYIYKFIYEISLLYPYNNIIFMMIVGNPQPHSTDSHALPYIVPIGTRCRV
jgi:hypothetical protein